MSKSRNLAVDFIREMGDNISILKTDRERDLEFAKSQMEWKHKMNKRTKIDATLKIDLTSLAKIGLWMDDH